MIDLLGASLRASAPNGTPAPLPSNPDAAYLRGRAEFDSVFGDVAKGKRNWQLAAFCAMGVAMVLAIGFVAIARESHIVPYVVEVDQLGRAQAFGPAERFRATDQRLIASQLAGFVRDVRSVVTDGAAQAELVRRSYAFVDQSAADFLNAYFANPANDPRLLARDGSRLVEIVSVLPLPDANVPNLASHRGDGLPARQTWKVSWTETTFPRGAGGLPSAAAWEGYFATRLMPPATTERIVANPLGLYVTAINWTRLATRAPVAGETLAPPTVPETSAAGAGAAASPHDSSAPRPSRAPAGAKE